VTGQVLTILTRQKCAEANPWRRRRPDAAVSDYGTMDFEDARNIIDAGTQYGREQGPRLAHLAVAPEIYATLNAARARREHIEPEIDALVIEGGRRGDDRIIRAKVETRPGTPVDREELRRDINRIYGLDDFQSVTFAINDVEGRRELVLKMRTKPWGPTYVRLGIHLEDDLKGNSSY